MPAVFKSGRRGEGSRSRRPTAPRRLPHGEPERAGEQGRSQASQPNGTVSLSFSVSLSHSHTSTRTLACAPSLSHSLTRTSTHTHTHTHTLTHTRALSLTGAVCAAQ